MTTVNHISASPLSDEDLQKAVIERLEAALQDAREGKVHILFCMTGEILDSGVSFAARTVLDFDYATQMALFIRDYMTTAFTIDLGASCDPKDRH